MHKIFFWSLLAGVALTGCKPFKGQIEVQRPFSIEAKDDTCRGKGCWPPRKIKVSVPKGTHSMKLDFQSADQLKLDIDLPNKGSKDIVLRAPLDNVPRNKGRFTLPGDKMDQKFNIEGLRDKEVKRSRTYYRVEECTYRRRVRVCEWVDHGEGEERNRRWECHYKYKTFYGEQDVEYHIKRTREDLKLQFVSLNGERALAEYDGERRSSKKIYTYKGKCY